MKKILKSLKKNKSNNTSYENNYYKFIIIINIDSQKIIEHLDINYFLTRNNFLQSAENILINILHKYGYHYIDHKIYYLNKNKLLLYNPNYWLNKTSNIFIITNYPNNHTDLMKYIKL